MKKIILSTFFSAFVLIVTALIFGPNPLTWTTGFNEILGVDLPHSAKILEEDLYTSNRSWFYKYQLVIKGDPVDIEAWVIRLGLTKIPDEVLYSSDNPASKNYIFIKEKDIAKKLIYSLEQKDSGNIWTFSKMERGNRDFKYFYKRFKPSRNVNDDIFAVRAVIRNDTLYLQKTGDSLTLGKYVKGLF
mgnify:CR=1 FL=1